MEASSQEVDRMIKRTDLFIDRVVMMLHKGKKKGSVLPGTEISERELKSYDSDVHELIVKLLQTDSIPEEKWISPMKYASRYGESSKRTEWTWLERFKESLMETKSLLKLYQEDRSGSGNTYNVEIKDSEGFVLNFDRSTAIVEIGNKLSDDQLATLAFELGQLRAALKQKAVTAEEDMQVALIAAAEIAAKKKDKKGMVENLKKVGAWVFKIATEIGVATAGTVLGEMLK